MPAPLVDRAETVRLDQLTHYPGNARRGNVAMIQESLRAFGQYRPLTANRRTNQVLAGNHLLRAMRAEGYEVGLVVWVDVDEAEALRINLVDNRSTDVARYDNGLLLEMLQSLEGDTAGTGFSDQNVRDLMAQSELEAAMIPVPYEAGGGEAGMIPTLFFGSIKVRLSIREASALTNLYAQYRNDNDSSVGFVAHLVGEKGAKPSPS